MGAGRASALREDKRRPSRASGNVACLLVFIAFGLYVFRLDSPPSPIFDEGLFYIPAARAYLAGLADPNFEHPPLSKLSIALGIATLGDGPWGWRFPAAFAGTLGIVLTYRLGKRLWGSQVAGVAGAGLLLVDFLWFEFSRLALLDVFQAVLVLLALNLALSRRWGGAGLALGLAAAAKWSAGWAVVPLVLMRGRSAPLLLLAAAIGYALPWLYNVAVLGEGFPELLDRHLRMLSYGTQVGAEEGSALELALSPAWWLLNGPLVVTAREDRSVWMVVMSNPLVFWGGLVAVGLLLQRPSARWLVIAVLALYLPWFLVARVKYFYYLLPVIPLLAAAIPGAWLLRVPRVWLVAYLTAAIAAFAGAYPMLTASVPR